MKLDWRFEIARSIANRQRLRYDVTRMRRGYEAVCKALCRPMPSVEVVDEFAGSCPVRIYRGKSSASLLYFHGGGFVLGSLESHDRFCRYLCYRSGMTIVSVQYRLAPESPHPACFDDAIESWSWLLQNSGRLGIDPSTCGVGGDSAGATIAISVAFAARNLRVQAPAFQFLLYPSCDMDMPTESRKLYSKGYLLDGQLMAFFRYQLLGNDDLDPLIAPARRGSLSQTPPTVVITAGFDPLRDEGKMYAARLEEDGVFVTYKQVDDLPHGFATFTRFASSRRGIDEALGCLRALLPRSKAVSSKRRLAIARGA